jgi:hypothetical protein
MQDPQEDTAGPARAPCAAMAKPQSQQAPESSPTRTRHVQPADPDERKRAAGAALASFQEDEQQPQLEERTGAVPGVNVPELVDARPEAEVTADVACIFRMLGLTVGLARANKRPGYKPDLERLDYRARKLAGAVARRLSPGWASAAFWLGLGADVACDVLEDLVREASEAPRPQHQPAVTAQ